MSFLFYVTGGATVKQLGTIASENDWKNLKRCGKLVYMGRAG